MAGRLLNRRELRKQTDEAERPVSPVEAKAAAAPKVIAAKATKAKKAPAAAKAKKPRVRKAPVRMRARWGVFDNNMKQVAVFDYSERDAAEAKLADLLSKKKTTHFMQIVKDAMPEPVVAEALIAV